MALFVNTNVAALNGQRNLNDVTARMNTNFERLSSGNRINSARDDAAGLQISNRLTTQIEGLNQANRNSNDGISIAQIAEGALSEMTSNIQRTRQLVVQGGNRTLSDDDRAALGEEFEKLLDINNDIANRTAFGDQKLLNSSSPESGFQIQSGAYAGERDTITTGNAELAALFGKVADDENITANISNMSVTNLDTYGTLGKVVGAYIAAGPGAATSYAAVQSAMSALFGDAGIGISLAANRLGEEGSLTFNASALTEILTAERSALTGTGQSFLRDFDVFHTGDGISTVDSTGATDAMLAGLQGFQTDTLLDAMTALVGRVDSMRATLGSEQNGLMSTISANSAAVVNVSDSRSRILETDFAAETAEMTRNQIIQQASTTILSQANQLPQTALSLLR